MSHTRVCVALTALAAAVLFASLSGGAHAAPQPELAKSNVDVPLRKVREELRESSQAMVRAAAAYTRAQQALPAARARTAAARARLASARAADVDAAQRLVAAESAVSRARRAAEIVSERLATHRAVLGTVARRMYQQGSLAQIGVVVQAESPADLSCGSSRSAQW